MQCEGLSICTSVARKFYSTLDGLLSDELGEWVNGSFSFNDFSPQHFIMDTFKHREKFEKFFSKHLNIFYLDSTINILLYFLYHITIPLSVFLSVHRYTLFLIHFQVNCSTVPLNTSACYNGFDEENGCISPNQLWKSNFREANKVEEIIFQEQRYEEK